jgi:transcriptional regulator GlxA family with amidase domain
MAAEADDEMIAAATALLRGFGADADPAIEQAAELVKRITEDQGLQRVAQLADASGLSARKLQRLFSDYVGVSPKWVMRRARLHEAALRVEKEGPASVDWAVLAADLGYADQAHLTRDFTATLGVPPTRYAAGPG